MQCLKFLKLRCLNWLTPLGQDKRPIILAIFALFFPEHILCTTQPYTLSVNRWASHFLHFCCLLAVSTRKIRGVDSLKQNVRENALHMLSFSWWLGRLGLPNLTRLIFQGIVRRIKKLKFGKGLPIAHEFLISSLILTKKFNPIGNAIKIKESNINYL